MNAIRICFLVIGLFLSSILFMSAQSPISGQGKYKKADVFFSLFNFEKAILQYKRIVKKDPSDYYALEKLATCYRLLGNNKEAEFWYNEVTKLPETKPADVFYYAQSLQANGQYSKAKETFQKYASINPDDPRGKRLALGIDMIKDMVKDSLRYSVVNLEGNSAADDYSPAYYKGTELAFPSARGEGKTDVWSAGSFTDIYVGKITVGGEIEEPQLLPGKANNRFHEGPLSFTPDGNRMYFTRNNYVKRKKGKSEDEIMKLKIFSSEFDGSTWGKLKELPFNSDEYSCGHPSLTKDGKSLYFSSDMPGGFGGLDLYVVQWKDSAWSAPVNLGSGINTQGNEQFPFIHEDGTLYFSSDSYEGLGGLDNYSATFQNGKWQNVQHLGYPLNTSADDFGIIFNKEKNSGYFASNRTGGKGRDDIYYFDSKGLLLRGLVYDRITGDPIDSATVYLVENGDTLLSKITNIEGRFSFKVDVTKKLLIPARKTGYNPNSLIVNLAGMDNSSPEVKIPLDKGMLMLIGKVVDVSDPKDIIPIATPFVVIENKTDKTRDTIIADGSGKFSYPVAIEKDYQLIAEKEEYFQEAPVDVTTKSIKPGIIEVTLEMQTIATGRIFRLQNIYYDFDKYNIRPDAAIELDRVVALMKKYPDMVIQLRSHTDSRATDSYNMWLSARRAESATNYLISKGVPLYNLTAAGFGETKLVNVCRNDEPCTEEAHQLNRRTEFKVIKQPSRMQIRGSVE